MAEEVEDEIAKTAEKVDLLILKGSVRSLSVIIGEKYTVNV